MLRRRWLSLLVLPLLALATTGCGYNTIQTLDEQAAQAQRNIEVQLQRRADLIPNLVATVKGFAAQEETIYTRVAEAQRGLVGALQRPGGASPQEMANANERLSQALIPMLTLVQAYPQLASNQQFLNLQDELTGTENRIAQSRTDYNTAVNEYNAYIRRFPAALTAKATGAKPREYFQTTTPGAREAPTVDFSKTAPAAPSTPATPSTPAPAGSTPK